MHSTIRYIPKRKACTCIKVVYKNVLEELLVIIKKWKQPKFPSIVN